MTEFPSELLANAQPLIGFYGLDLNVATHKAIFDSFNRGGERPSIQYKIIPNNYEFPTKKPKRQSYEWYSPKHLIKKNWILKYQHVIPALIVVYIELEWKEPQWSEKLVQCSTMIQQLKTKLQDRQTRIALVLLHKTAPVLANDDMIASERASALANSCEINTKNIYVLPFNDQSLISYTIRLESAFLELAQSFYIGMLKNYRSHQTGSHHQTLKVRHQFKMGFISELRLDLPTALKHYTQAYANIENIRVVDTNCLEVKTVAGFINYKICRLMFKLNLPRDSITQFKAHIEKYKTRSGFKELIFEHHGWLSQQFSYFGEIFNEAVKNGLAAIQTQNPAIYYLKAAEHVYKRREIFQQNSIFVPNLPNEDPASPSTQFSLLYSDYFGVRNGNEREQGIDQQIIALVRELEGKYNYSTVIINLLSQAMSQFKIYRCGRSRKKCAVMMADEYFKSGEFTKALTLYSLMLQDFRQEKWYSIFTDILTKTIQSATLAASVNDLVSGSVEAMSMNIKISITERQLILENLWKVFNNSAPTFQNQIAPEIIESWRDSLASCRSPISVNLDEIPKFIDCKFSFKSNRVEFIEPTILYIYLRSNSDVPIKIAKVIAVLTSNTGTVRLQAKSGWIYEFESSTKSEKLSNEFNAHDFILENGKCFKFELETKPGQFFENSEITVSAVELTMGTEKVAATLSIQKSLNLVKQFHGWSIHADYMEFIKIVKSCYIIPSFHLTSIIAQNQPMLLNEYYKIQINLSNTHTETISNVNATIFLPTNSKNRVFLTKSSTESQTKLSACIKFNVGEMAAGSNTSIEYFIISMIEGNIELKQSLCYEIVDVSESNTTAPAEKESPSEPIAPTVFTGSEENLDIMVERLENNVVRKRHDDILIVTCVEEFSFDSKFYSLDRKPLTTCYENEEFLLRLCLKTKSPFNIDIIDAFFIADPNITEKFNFNENFVKSNILRGCSMENVLTLSPINNSAEWITKEKVINISNDASMIFTKAVVDGNTIKEKPAEIINPVKDEEDPFSLKRKDLKSLDYNTSNDEKININNCLDVVELMPDATHKKGFINAKINVLQNKNVVVNQEKKFGLYCIKWKKTSSEIINESKFLIEGVDVIKPLVNIYYTSGHQRVFVREIFTYKILLKNSREDILHMTATIGSSDGFMLSGHKQLTFTIFPSSDVELTYNLYPLKANFQKLPEIKMEIKNYMEEQQQAVASVPIADKEADNNSQVSELSKKQTELNELLERWLPKSIFVHPPNRNSA